VYVATYYIYDIIFKSFFFTFKERFLFVFISYYHKKTDIRLIIVIVATMFRSSSQSQEQYTETDNCGVALRTSGNHVTDYFMMYTRTLGKAENEDYIERCWSVDPKKTIAIIFNGRDRLNGKKEKKVSNEAMQWLRLYKPETYKLNIMNYVNKYGCWKDLLYIAYHIPKINQIEDYYELGLFAIQLNQDSIKLKDNSSVSLCAKWAPSEKDRNDKRKQFAQKLATLMYTRDDPKKMEKYRKCIVPLRKKINIVETLMCSGKWDEIKFENVPGVASKRLLKAFRKHQPDRYQQYLDEVKAGKKTIKVTGLLPHELVKFYIDNHHGPNETIELQWRTLLENVRKDGTLSKSIAIADVSGSMFHASNGDIPAQVSIALSILTSLCCTGNFYKKVITFSTDPTLLELPNESLYDCFTKLQNVYYGLSTDFVKCNKCIIDYAKSHHLSSQDLPDKLFVFTDMQFDAASVETNSNMETIYTHIVHLYKQNNYTPPKFIFWNLNSDTQNTFPVDIHVENTAMVSGFSEQLLKIFMKYDEFNPQTIVDEVLQPYLDDIVIHEDEK